MDTNEMLCNFETTLNNLMRMYGDALDEKVVLIRRIRELEIANDALRMQLDTYAREAA